VTGVFKLSRRIVEESFSIFRSCGGNRHECQLYWLSSWDSPLELIEVSHPRHTASRVGLSIDSDWITDFWNDLSRRRRSVSLQVHTHPGAAFHSAVDDAYPLLCHPGFLSLVIPDFAMGQVGFEHAYLAEIQPDGSWREVPIASHLRLCE
jgi:hypothetical protein